MMIPRIGDEWEFRPRKGAKHTTKKKIVQIYWRPSKVTGRMCPWLQFSHTPKARYIGSARVKYFLKELAITRITAAEHGVQRTCCKHCGNNVKETDTICWRCGTRNPTSR